MTLQRILTDTDNARLLAQQQQDYLNAAAAAAVAAANDAQRPITAPIASRLPPTSTASPPVFSAASSTPQFPNATIATNNTTTGLVTIPSRLHVPVISNVAPILPVVTPSTVTPPLHTFGVASVSRDDMAANAQVSPEVYKAGPNQDAKDWLNALTYWMGYKQMANIDCARIFPLFLRDAAAVWFETVPASTRLDWELLQRTFLERFRHPDCIQWVDTSDVFAYKQAADQSVDDFLTIMQKKINRVQDLPVKTQIHAIISGLRPEIRQHVIQHTCDSIQEVRRWATISESGLPAGSSGANTDLVQAIKAMQDQMKDLALQKSVQQHTIAAIPNASAIQQTQPFVQPQTQHLCSPNNLIFPRIIVAVNLV